jgi:hypothetical protein
MASITSWIRLEPRARDADLLAGAEARLHDPLWLLARQWQMRELAGFDGGSTIASSAHVTSSRLDAIRARGHSWQPFAPDVTPLEVVLGSAPDDPQPALASRVRAGRQLIRMLALAEVPTVSFLAAFPLAVPTGQLLDDDDRRLLAVMRGRVPDGDAAAAMLAPLVANADLPASFGIVAAQIPRASDVVRDWLRWRAALTSSAPGPTWRQESNDYRFDARASGDLGTVELAFAHAEDRPVRWYDATATTSTTASGGGRDVVAMPSRVRYRGMPARRYWDLEDGAVHWPSIDAGPGDVGRVVLVEIALTLADHWLMVPIEVPAGSLTRIDSLTVTDTFETAVPVRSAAELDGAGTHWRFCEVSSVAGTAGPLLLVPPAASEPIVGRPLEAVDLSRDEVSNVVWAIERTRAGADGRPRNVPAPTSAPLPADGNAPLLVYRVGPDVPDCYHPYVPHEGPTGIELARAAEPGGIEGRVSLPARFSPAAIPARPHQLRRVDELVRGSDGTYHWVRKRVLVATPPRPSVTLQFDQLVERSRR